MRTHELTHIVSLMLVSQEPVIIPTQPLGWSLVGILLVSHPSEINSDPETAGLVADASITYAGQRTSPTTVTICAYASVSSRSRCEALIDDQVIFSNCIQWALYGNGPSLVAFIGMFAILTAGLYGVVCPLISPTGFRAHFCEIYGPDEEPKESDAASVDPETAPLVQNNGDRDPNYGSDRVPGVC